MARSNYIYICIEDVSRFEPPPWPEICVLAVFTVKYQCRAWVENQSRLLNVYRMHDANFKPGKVRVAYYNGRDWHEKKDILE